MESQLIARDKPILNKADSSLPTSYDIHLSHYPYTIVQFSLLCYKFCILSKTKCKSLYYHFRQDHESSSFQKLAGNKWICDFFHGFRSSQSTSDLLIVVFARTARPFNRSGATQAVALDIFKAFNRIWYAVLLHKLKPYWVLGQIFGCILSLLSDRQFLVVLGGDIFTRISSQ